jgi:hypothetical protein
MDDPKDTVDRALAEGQQKKDAEDWLAAFAKRSQEALAKKAEEKKLAPPPDEKLLIEQLSRKDHTEYDHMRVEVADTLGIRVGTLDEKVEAFRKRHKKASSKDAAPPIDAAKAKSDAGDLVTCPDILERFGTAISAAGLIGETNNAKILYLATTSRLFERPISVALKGVSSGGKSFTVESTLKFFPASAYFARTSCSDKALYFSQEDFRHRMLVLFEAVGLGSDPRPGVETNHFAYAVRTLLSENVLRYEIAVKTDEGIKSIVIENEGPTGLITTTTAAKLHPENETRLLSLGVIDTPAQTKAIMRAAATGKVDETDYAPWHAFQEWLTTGERRVAIPYAPMLSDAIPPIAVRLRRDFPALLSLIRAHALLHRETRARDDRGYIVATVADYTAVYGLVEKLFGEGIEATVPAIVRETVEKVAELLADGASAVSATALAKALQLDKGAIHHRVGKAIKAGYLVNQQDRKGKPAQYFLGDPLPGELEILPAPGAVECSPDYTYTPSVDTPPETPSTLQQLCKIPSTDSGLGSVEGASTVPPVLNGVQRSLSPYSDSGKSTTVEVLNGDRVSTQGYTYPLHNPPRSRQRGVPLPPGLRPRRPACGPRSGQGWRTCHLAPPRRTRRPPARPRP